MQLSTYLVKYKPERKLAFVSVIKGNADQCLESLNQNSFIFSSLPTFAWIVGVVRFSADDHRQCKKYLDVLDNVRIEFSAELCHVCNLCLRLSS